MSILGKQLDLFLRWVGVDPRYGSSLELGDAIIPTMRVTKDAGEFGTVQSRAQIWTAVVVPAFGAGTNSIIGVTAGPDGMWVSHIVTLQNAQVSFSNPPPTGIDISGFANPSTVSCSVEDLSAPDIPANQSTVNGTVFNTRNFGPNTVFPFPRGGRINSGSVIGAFSGLFMPAAPNFFVTPLFQDGVFVPPACSLFICQNTANSPLTVRMRIIESLHYYGTQGGAGA